MALLSRIVLFCVMAKSVNDFLDMLFRPADRIPDFSLAVSKEVWSYTVL